MLTALLRAVVALALLSSAVSRAAGTPWTTCRTSGTVNEGQSAFINCEYSHDLKGDRRDFYVYRVQNDSLEPVIITMCQWEGNNWNCDTDKSYKIETANISNQVTIEILSAKQSLAGTYFCKTVPTDLTSKYLGCDLTVKRAPPITCATSGYVTEGDPAFLRCNYHFDLTRRRQDLYVYRFQDDESKPVMITLCAWDGDRLNCETDKDYALTTAITSRHVTLDIQSARPIHSGKYMCKTLPTNKPLHTSEECTLRVQGAETSWSGLECILFILPLCVVAVLLLLALVLLIRKRSIIVQRCTCSLSGCGQGYSILRDQPETSNTRVFVVPIEKNATQK